MSIREELNVLERRANRPARWMLVLVVLLLVGVYLPLMAVLATASIPELVCRTLVPLIIAGLFLLAQWLLSGWSIRRFRRLSDEWQAARDAAAA